MSSSTILASKRILYLGILIGIVFSVPFLGLGGGGPAANTCVTSNIFCGPIKFDSISSVNGTNTGTLTINNPNVIRNETVLVVASVGFSFIDTKVTSVTDTLSDVYTPIIRVFHPPHPGDTESDELEVWASKVAGPNLVTVTWNVTSNPVQLEIVNYLNVAGFGATNSTNGIGIGSPQSSPIKIVTQTSGSWVFGALNITPASASCQAITTSTNFVRRIDTCNVSAGSANGEVEISDNATSIRNSVKLIYQPIFTASTVGFEEAELELTPMDAEPSTPDFTNFCTLSPFNCVSHENFADVNTIPNALNKGLALNTAYCTGITTKALTTTGNPFTVLGAYSALDLNTTGIPKIFLQVYVSTNVPSTTFGVGLCATGGSIVATGSISFTTSGSLLLNRTFTTAMNGVDGITGSSPASGTYYGWIEVTAQDFVIGSLGMDQLCSNSSFGICTIFMQEQK